MENSSNAQILLRIFVLLSAIVFDLNHAAVRQRRTILLPALFGRGDSSTTTRTVIKSPLGFLSLSVVEQKRPSSSDPCQPFQNAQQASTRRSGLIDIKIPSLFGRQRTESTVAPSECLPPSTEILPDRRPYPSSPSSTVDHPENTPQKLGPTYVPPSTSWTSSTPKPVVVPISNEYYTTSSTSAVPFTQISTQHTQQPSTVSTTSTQGATSSTTENVDALIDSIFGEENENENNGSGKIDLRWRGKSG